MGDLTTFETIIIAIVEGLTEFLPVSSTGHMIIAQNVLGVESTEFVKAFTVIIQFHTDFIRTFNHMIIRYHSVWCDSFGSLPLLETFLPAEPCTGAGEYTCHQALSAQI